MGNLMNVALPVLLAAAGVLGSPYLPELPLPGYRASFAGLLFLQALLGVILYLRGGPRLWKMFLILLPGLWGVHYLGGPDAGQNALLLVFPLCLAGLLSDPGHTFAGLLFIWASVLVSFANARSPFLPRSLPPLEIPQFAGVFFPLILTALAGLGAMVAAALRPQPAAAPAAAPSLPRPSGHPAAGAGGETPVAVPEAAPAGALIGVSLDAPEIERGEAARFAAPEYTRDREREFQVSMEKILDTVVFFMSRNFKAYSAVGFLTGRNGKHFYVNSNVSKSQFFNPGAEVGAGSGLLGSVMRKKGGFVSGELKSYGERLEYYNGDNTVNSVMVMPIVPEGSTEAIGLLVVDSTSLRAFTDEHKELLKRFTQVAAAMISNARLNAQVNRQAQWADTLYGVTSLLTKVLKVEEVVGVLTESLARVFPHDRIVLCIYNGTSRKGQVWNIVGDPGGLARGFEFAIQGENSLYGHAFRSRKELVVLNFAEERRYVRFEAAEDPALAPAELMIAPVMDDSQAVIAVVGLESGEPGVYSEAELRKLRTLLVNFSTAITKAKMFGEMERLATVDGLTQIPNHRNFQEFLAVELERSKRYKNPLSLLLMDIDHFKKFNDTYGHPVGDLVLKNVAAALRRCVRGTDLCARYGGEEFVVVVIQSTEEQAAMLAERIRAAVEAMELDHEGQNLKVTVSIGCATFAQDAGDKQALIDCADKAMYHSKRSGRNRVSRWSAVKDVELPPEAGGH